MNLEDEIYFGQVFGKCMYETSHEEDFKKVPVCTVAH